MHPIPQRLSGAGGGRDDEGEQPCGSGGVAGGGGDGGGGDGGGDSGDNDGGGDCGDDDDGGRFERPPTTRGDYPMHTVYSDINTLDDGRANRGGQKLSDYEIEQHQIRNNRDRVERIWFLRQQQRDLQQQIEQLQNPGEGQLQVDEMTGGCPLYYYRTEANGTTLLLTPFQHFAGCLLIQGKMP